MQNYKKNAVNNRPDRAKQKIEQKIKIIFLEIKRIGPRQHYISQIMIQEILKFRNSFLYLHPQKHKGSVGEWLKPPVC